MTAVAEYLDPDPGKLDLNEVGWRFNEAVSLLREATTCARYGTGNTELADEIDEGLPLMQAALEHVVAHAQTAERYRRQIEFLEILADGGALQVNGIPWREMFDRINAIVSDPV